LGFSASEYYLPSSEFLDWGFWLLANISAVDEISTGFVMRCRFMARRVWIYPWSILGKKL